MQPLIRDSDGVVRFQPNSVVVYLFHSGRLSLNEIALMSFPDEDRVQIAQLLGYSIRAFGELSYVSDDLYAEAERKAEDTRRAKL